MIARGLPRWDGQPSSGAAFDGLRSVLVDDAPVREERCGHAYRFGERVGLHVAAEAMVIDEGSAHLLEPHFPYTRSVLAARAPLVVSLWRDEVERAGAQPLYSTSWTTWPLTLSPRRCV